MKKHIKPQKAQKQTHKPPVQQQVQKAQKAAPQALNALQEIEILAERYANFVKQHKHRNAYMVSLEMARKTEQAGTLMHIGTALMYFQTANMARFIKEYKLASQHYQKLITILEGIPHDKRVMLVDVYNYTAQAFEQDKNFEQAAVYNIKSIAALRKKKGHSKERLCVLHGKVAELYLLNKQYTLSTVFFKKALNIQQKQSIERPHFRYLCYHAIGFNCAQLDKPKAALLYYIQAFMELEPVKEQYHGEQATLAHIIGSAYYEKGKYKDTLNWYEKELLLIKQYEPQDTVILDSLVRVYISVLHVAIAIDPKINLLPYKQFLKAHFPTYKL
jgi:tetratricopeptide (TPR) repeat protein